MGFDAVPVHAISLKTNLRYFLVLKQYGTGIIQWKKSFSLPKENKKNAFIECKNCVNSQLYNNKQYWFGIKKYD